MPDRPHPLRWLRSAASRLVRRRQSRLPFGIDPLPHPAAPPSLTVRGWATHSPAPDRITISINSLPSIQCRLGLPRPDAALRFPHQPGAESCGWAGRLPLEGLSDGTHWVRAEIYAGGRLLQSLSRSFLLTRAQSGPARYQRWIVRHPLDSTAAPPPPGWTILLDPGTRLHPAALSRLTAFAHRHPDAAAVYSDADHLTPSGERTRPLFLPDWSPELFDQFPAMPGLLAVRDSLLPGDADPLRALLARGIQAHHLPEVLAHRTSPFRLTPQPQAPPGAAPAVQILISSGGRLDILQRNLKALRATAGYPNFEITVIDNSRTGDLAAMLSHHGAARFDWRRRPFDFAAMNNAAARHSSAPLLLFLNDDVEGAREGWLRELVLQVTRPGVGAAGAKLLYPGGLLQHAGITVGVCGACVNAFARCEPDDLDLRPWNPAESVRNVAAVTGACLLTPRDLFLRLGGFDQKRFPVAYNDVDYCLRVLEHGQRIVYTPRAALFHHEAYSKPLALAHAHPREIAAFRARWPTFLSHDPYYNPNLTRASPDWEVAD
ncbi:MAG: glycosyltransferase [Bryobacteraceae bacterium]|nr:glycosyltransferase [Bryobacteraceae bacterium]